MSPIFDDAGSASSGVAPRPGVIELYVAELGAALRGPRRAKADLLTEARHSLEDATAAYQSRGLSAARAQRRAVAEFGAVGEVAPGYQTELGLSAGRRTAWLLTLVISPQHLVWDVALPRFVPPRADAPGPLFRAATEWTAAVGWVVLVGALLAAFACGVGTRYVRWTWVPRATALFAYAAAGILAALGVALTVMGRVGGALLAPTGLPWTAAFLLLPLGLVVGAARRCVA